MELANRMPLAKAAAAKIVDAWSLLARPCCSLQLSQLVDVDVEALPFGAQRSGSTNERRLRGDIRKALSPQATALRRRSLDAATRRAVSLCS
jgi:hypothetical protein